MFGTEIDIGVVEITEMHALPFTATLRCYLLLLFECRQFKSGKTVGQYQIRSVQCNQKKCMPERSEHTTHE